jgi:hypothetical protein
MNDRHVDMNIRLQQRFQITIPWCRTATANVEVLPHYFVDYSLISPQALAHVFIPNLSQG